MPSIKFRCTSIFQNKAFLVNTIHKLFIQHGIPHASSQCYTLMNIGTFNDNPMNKQSLKGYILVFIQTKMIVIATQNYAQYLQYLYSMIPKISYKHHLINTKFSS